MIAKVHDIALDKNSWNLKGSTEIAILLIAERLRIMRVSRETSFRGRYQVASCRYFVPSGTRRRSRDDDALGENERLDGDDKRRRSQQQEARKSYSGFRIENRAIESAACFILLFLPSFLSSDSRRILRHIHTLQERRESKRTMKTNLSIAAWRDPFNCLAFLSVERLFLPLPFHSRCRFFLFFFSSLHHGGEKASTRRLGFYSFTASILNITLAPFAFLPSFPSFLFRSFFLSFFLFDMALRAASLFRHFLARLLHHRSYKADESCLVTRPCRPLRSFTIH